MTNCSLYANVTYIVNGNSLQIEWATKAVKDMRRLQAQDRERVVAKVEQYAADPASLANQVKKLTGSDYLRIRVGAYRVIFRTEHGQMAVMVVLRVRHRSEAYD